MKIVKENKVQEAANYAFDKARVQKLNAEPNDYFMLHSIAMALKKEGWI